MLIPVGAPVLVIELVKGLPNPKALVNP